MYAGYVSLLPDCLWKPISIYSLYVGKTLWLSSFPTLHPAGIVSVDAQPSVDPCQEGGQPGYVLQDDGLEHK